MAERRCLSKKIVESDAFYHLTPAAQAIYVHLCMIADDDGFVNCADSVVKMYRNGRANVSLLLDARFIMQIDGLIVIKHWRIMNSLKNDRAKTLQYPETAKKIWIKENRAYTDHECDGCQTLFEFKDQFLKESKHGGVDSKWNPVGIPKEEKRTEQNITEQKRREGNAADAANEVSFSDIFNLYPEEHRGNRRYAEKAFIEAGLCSAEKNQMLSSLQIWISSEDWKKDGGRFIPNLETWIYLGRWRQEPQCRGFQERRELDEGERAAIKRMLEEE